MTLSAQWTKITDILSQAIGRAQHARELQITATQHLDLAQYALWTLSDELSAVMKLPNRRERAEVHVLEPAQPAAKNQALAA